MRYAISVDDVKAAANRLDGQHIRTPLLENPALNSVSGGRVLIKAENLQLTGSFKFRGAFNRLSALSAVERKRGVVAFSSGNHAQGVAAAAKLLSINAKIVMPSDAPQVKADSTRRYGATIVAYDRYTENREEIADKIAAEEGRIVVPSFDDPYIMAGQGTVGLEAAEAASAGGLTIDQAVICCGGGGLSSGALLALTDKFPNMQGYVAEPKDFDDTARSLETGIQQRIDPNARSICDALLSPAPGHMPLEILLGLGVKGLRISDREAMQAVAYAARALKLVVEPGGAVALAAILAGKLETAGKTTLIILSGGNIDALTLQEAMALESD